MSAAEHPFYARSYDGLATFYVSSEDRIAAARQFDAATCRRALALDDLQRTVRAALERRLRQLERAP